MITMNWQARLPSVINDLLTSIGINPADCLRGDGRFTIDVANCESIDLIPLSDQRVVLDTMIGAVALDMPKRREQMQRVLKYAAARMHADLEIVTLADDGATFQLQRYLDPDLTPVQVEDAMNAYLRAIDWWQALLYPSRN